MTPQSDFEREFYCAIGKISVNHEYVEYWMRQFIGLLIGPDNKLGGIISIPLSSHLLPRYLMALYEYKVKDEEKVKGFREMIKHNESALKRRDECIHAVWFVSPLEGFAARQRPQVKVNGEYPKDRGLKLRESEHTLSELNNIVKDLQQFARALHANMYWYIQDNAEEFKDWLEEYERTLPKDLGE